MPKAFLIPSDKLPSPVPGYDLTVWQSEAPVIDDLASWARWASAVVVSIGETSNPMAVHPDGTVWEPQESYPQAGVFLYHSDKLSFALLSGDALKVPEWARGVALLGISLVIGMREERFRDYRCGLWREVQANQLVGLSFCPEPSLLIPCESDPSSRGRQAAIKRHGGYEVSWEETDVLSAKSKFPILSGLRKNLYQAEKWWAL